MNVWSLSGSDERNNRVIVIVSLLNEYNYRFALSTKTMTVIGQCPRLPLVKDLFLHISMYVISTKPHAWEDVNETFVSFANKYKFRWKEHVE